MHRLAKVGCHVATATASVVGDEDRATALAKVINEARQRGALAWHDVALGTTLPCSDVQEGPLTQVQYEAFWRDGWAVAPIPSDVILGGLRSAVEDLVELNAAGLVEAGRLSVGGYETTLGAPVETRQVMIEKLVPGSSWELFLRSCNGPSSKLNRSPAVRQMQSSVGMMSIVRQLLGADIEIDLTAAFSFRCKCPNHNMTDQVGASGGEWHQDLAYGSPDGEETIAVTGWLPLQATTAEMGTLRLIKGGHRAAYLRGNGHTLPHRVGWGNEMSVAGIGNPTAFMQLEEDPEGQLGEAVDVECPEGHFILMSNLLPHKGGINSSSVMRWSFDMRWIDARMPAGVPTVPVSRPQTPGWEPDYAFCPNLGPNLKHPWTDHKTDIHMQQAAQRKTTIALKTR